MLCKFSKKHRIAHSHHQHIVIRCRRERRTLIITFNITASYMCRCRGGHGPLATPVASRQYGWDELAAGSWLGLLSVAYRAHQDNIFYSCIRPTHTFIQSANHPSNTRLSQNGHTSGYRRHHHIFVQMTATVFATGERQRKIEREKESERE